MEAMETKERRRLDSLRRYRILDTDPESGFDDLTMLASQVCETPIALITLVDADRQWFKSRVGISATETSRNVAFCHHAIQQSDLFIVQDALEDERFRKNPLVVSQPKIRFYAGAPLFAREGEALGTLCVIDRVPRSLTDYQEEALSALRRQAVMQLELRRNLFELKRTLRERDEAETEQLRLFDELHRSHESVKKLSGLIPLCATCTFDMTVPAKFEAIETVVSGVLQVLEGQAWDDRAEFSVETSLREALANAIEHGCQRDPSKQVQCCVTSSEGGEIVIVVRDPGKGFDFESLPDPRTDENVLETAGRGVFLINELMDEVRYADGGRRVYMKKNSNGRDRPD